MWENLFHDHLLALMTTPGTCFSEEGAIFTATEGTPHFFKRMRAMRAIAAFLEKHIARRADKTYFFKIRPKQHTFNTLWAKWAVAHHFFNEELAQKAAVFGA